MAAPLSYVPVFTFVHQVRGLGLLVFVSFIVLTAFFILAAYLLYKLIGDIGYMEVDQDRRLRGFFSMYVVSLLLMVPYMLFFEEAEPVTRWTAWAVMVIILFIAAYSISKQYIIGKENIK